MHIRPIISVKWLSVVLHPCILILSLTTQLSNNLQSVGWCSGLPLWLIDTRDTLCVYSRCNVPERTAYILFSRILHIYEMRAAVFYSSDYVSDIWLRDEVQCHCRLFLIVWYLSLLAQEQHYYNGLNATTGVTCFFSARCNIYIHLALILRCQCLSLSVCLWRKCIGAL